MADSFTAFGKFLSTGSPRKNPPKGGCITTALNLRYAGIKRSQADFDPRETFLHVFLKELAQKSLVRFCLPVLAILALRKKRNVFIYVKHYWH
jgi:hypothetical protein